MHDAFINALYFPAIRSAALRSIAALVVQGSVNGHLDFLLGCLVVSCQHMLVVMRLHHIAHVSGLDLLSPYYQRNLYYGLALSFKLCVNGNTFRTACQITFYRLIGRCRKTENRIVHIMSFIEYPVDCTQI